MKPMMTPEHEALRDALLAAQWQTIVVEDIRVALVEALEHSEALLAEHETTFPASMGEEEALNRADLLHNTESVSTMLAWLNGIIEGDAIALQEVAL